MDTKTLEQQVADELALSITNCPDAWCYRDTEKDILIGPNGIHLSVNYLTIYAPARLKFGYWNRRRIRRAVRQWTRGVGNALADRDRRAALFVLRQSLQVSLRMAA